MAHDSRTDFAMTMLIIFILIYGAGTIINRLPLSAKIKFSIDYSSFINNLRHLILKKIHIAQKIQFGGGSTSAEIIFQAPA